MQVLQTNKLNNLILVAGHSVYIGKDFVEPANDNNWCLENFQVGEPHFYIEHIHRGVELAKQDPKSLLIFSGGQTRLEAGPRSEATSYWLVANHFSWWKNTNVKLRATTEEYARDSFENLLFGICRFYECTKQYPQKVTVVSWAFKEKRFSLHRNAIRFPEENYTFEGVNNPVDLTHAQIGENDVVAAFKADPYGTGVNPIRITKKKIINLGKKRSERNPFNRKHSYTHNCPDLSELLSYAGPAPYPYKHPW